MFTGAVKGVVTVSPLMVAVAVPEATNWPFCNVMLLMVGTTLSELGRGFASALGMPIAKATVTATKLAAVLASHDRRLNEPIYVSCIVRCYCLCSKLLASNV